MFHDELPDLTRGGAYAWQLPYDESGPARARFLLATAMSQLNLDKHAIEDGKLAVSECATNALCHGSPADSARSPLSPELWVWIRTQPEPQLVVSVFDSLRVDLPRSSGADLLADYGKGLDLLTAVTAEWESQPSRSRVTSPPIRGKTVRFCLPLPPTRLRQAAQVSMANAANALLCTLAAQGVRASLHSDDTRVSVLELPGLNVWISNLTGFSWREEGRCIRHPLIDLQETTDRLISHLERRNALLPF